MDVLKVDVDCVRRMNCDRTARAAVEAVLAIGRSLGVPVIAQGMENDEQLAGLRATGYAFGQGFRWSRAVPADSVRTVLGLRG